MVSYDVKEEGDRLIVTLDPGQPVELTDLADSFSALANLSAIIDPARTTRRAFL